MSSTRQGGRIARSRHIHPSDGQWNHLHRFFAPLRGFHDQRMLYDAGEESEGDNLAEVATSPHLILPRRINYFTLLGWRGSG